MLYLGFCTLCVCECVAQFHFVACNCQIFVCDLQSLVVQIISSGITNFLGESTFFPPTALSFEAVEQSNEVSRETLKSISPCFA